jgi:hypothetical protein
MLCTRSSFYGEGPLIKIGITATDVLIAESPHLPVTIWALIDTGADITSIFPSVAMAANVFPVEKRHMVSANHTTASNVYLVNLQVHLSGGAIIEFRPWEVMECSGSERRKARALLGRDVLCSGANSFMMANGVYELCLEPPQES